MKKKIIILVAVIIVCITCYLYFPRKVISQVSDVSTLTVAYSKAEYILKDGDYHGEVTQNQKIFERSSKEYNELLSILKKYTYHRGSTFDFTELPNDTITISVVLDLGKNVITIDSHRGIEIDDHRYEVGYFGNYSSDKLCKDIIRLFE